MLGAEKDIIAQYVNTGQVKIIFWPITDFGATSVDAAVAAYCVGQQDTDAFWIYHDRLYENFPETYSGDRAYFVSTAVSAGADQATFEACYDGSEARTVITGLDDARKSKGIFNRPTFDINGQIIVGAQPFSTFDQAIQAALP